MSGAVISSNTTFKVNGAVSATDNAGTLNTTTLYTAPANGFAIIQIYFLNSSSGGTATEIRINDLKYYFYQDISVEKTESLNGVYIGPSQTVKVVFSASTSASLVNITGVEFINSP